MASTNQVEKSNGNKDFNKEEKLARSREAVKKCREKAKQNQSRTSIRIEKLRQDNKYLEGKIEEQKKTKKYLQELVMMQSMKTNRTLTPKEMELLIDD